MLMSAGLDQRFDGDEVLAWRAHELERCGYDREAAELIATRLDVDLHRAVELKARGCDTHTALEILL